MKKILILLFLALLATSAFGAWTQKYAPAEELNDIAGLATTSLATVCAVGDNGAVYKSNDYGTSWSSITSGTIGANRLTSADIVGNSLWVAGGTKTFVSTDWGGSWTEKTGGTLPGTGILGLAFGGASKGVVVGFTAGNAKVSYTSNGGTTWTDSTPGGMSGSAVYAADFADANTVWIVGNSGDIYRSTDGGQNWTQPGNSSTITSNDLRDVYFLDADHGFIVGLSGTFLYTTNGSAASPTWTAVSVGDENYGVHFIDANTGWISWRDSAATRGKITKMTFSGSSWASNLEYTTTADEVLNKVYFTDQDNGWVAGSTGSAGIVYAGITPLAITSVVQKSRPSQHQVPQGFFGDLTIAGSNFQVGSWTPGRVSFSGSGITVNSVTRGSLTVNVSVGASATAGSQNLTITNIDGSSDTLINALTISPAPTVISADPTTITQGTTANVTINGSGYQSGITTGDVVFSLSGITVNSVVVNGSSSLTANITAASSAAPGTGNITVTNPDGGTATGSDVFSVTPAGVTPPTISSVIPGSGRQGETLNLTVSGANFHAAPAVTFGNGGITVNSVNFVDAATLTANISISATATAGFRTVTVRNTDDGGIGSRSNAFRVKTAGAVDPTVSSISPAFGYAGGTNFYITGQGFQSDATVSFSPPAGASSTANIIINSVEFVGTTSLRIDATIPQGATLGLWDVTVINPSDGGSGTLSDGFEVRAQTSPAQVVGNKILAYPNPYRGNGPLRIQWVSSGPDVVQIKSYNPDGHQVLKTPPTINAVPGYNTVVFNKPDFWEFDNGMKLFLIKSTTQNNVTGKIQVMVVNGP